MGSYYFGYATRLGQEHADHQALRAERPGAQPPTAKFVVKGRAPGHALAFRAAGNRTDRGHCHLASGPDAAGSEALGVVYEHSDEEQAFTFNDYEIYHLTVLGDDGRKYECYTRRLKTPGSAVRVPDGDLTLILTGLKERGFPQAYIDKVVATQKAAAPGSTG